MTNSNLNEVGWVLFWVLLVLVILCLAFVFNWIWYVILTSLLIVFFIGKYKEDKIGTLWVAFLITLLVLTILVFGLTFGNSMNFITGTEWKRIDFNTCEKTLQFKGLGDDDCNKIITLFLNEKSNDPKLVNGRNNYSVNHSLGLLVNPTTIPQCYEERCK